MEENKVAKTLFYIGIIQMILGFLIGFAFATQESYTIYGNVHVGFSFSTFLLFIASGFITGMLFIGFSEVIKLLHSINDKMPVSKQESNNDEPALKEHNTISPNVSWTLSEVDKQKITERYHKEDVIEIIPSYLENYCIVKLQIGSDEIMRIVDIGGFGAKEVQDDEFKEKILTWYHSLD